MDTAAVCDYDSPTFEHSNLPMHTTCTRQLYAATISPRLSIQIPNTHDLHTAALFAAKISPCLSI